MYRHRIKHRPVVVKKSALATRVARIQEARLENDMDVAQQQDNQLDQQFADAANHYRHQPLRVYLAQRVGPDPRLSARVMCKGTLNGAAKRHPLFVHLSPWTAIPPGGYDEGQCMHVTSYAWTHFRGKHEANASLKLFVWSWHPVSGTT